MPPASRSRGAARPSRRSPETRRRTDRCRDAAAGSRRSRRWRARRRMLRGGAPPPRIRRRSARHGAVRPGRRPRRRAAACAATTARRRRSPGSRTARGPDRASPPGQRSGCAAPSTCPIAVRRRPRHCLRHRTDRRSAGSGIAQRGGQQGRRARSGPRRRAAGCAVPAAGPAGGSHTRCAAGPWPASRSSTAPDILRPDGASRLDRAADRADYPGAEHPHRCRRTRGGVRAQRPGSESVRRRRPAGSRRRDRRAGGKRRDCPARRGIRPRTGFSGRAGRTGGRPVRAADPRPGVGWPAAGGCPATGRAGRSPRRCRRNPVAG